MQIALFLIAPHAKRHFLPPCPIKVKGFIVKSLMKINKPLFFEVCVKMADSVLLSSGDFEQILPFLEPYFREGLLLIDNSKPIFELWM